jgi:cation:H+ antiporter
MVWLQFACCAAVILYAGSRISRYGELIAEKSGLSASWVGLILLAVITSLSQLVASLSAAVVHNLPDMAVSGLLGSCMFNMMVIGLLDLASRGIPVSRMVHEGHILSAGFGIILIGGAAVDILFGKHLLVLTFLHSMDLITIAFVPIYALAMRIAFKFERARLNELAELKDQKSESSKDSWAKLISCFLACALCIVGASYYLPAIAANIANLTGCGESFIGGSFIAVATCLPEVAVSVSAARRGAFDMAIASLLGSNLCYIVILAITDFCYVSEPLLRHVSQINALAALSAMISMAIVIIALTYKSEKKFLFLAGDAIALILVYILAEALMFTSH